MARPYYNKIAKTWHEATGATGGPFKKFVLNDLLLDRIGFIDGMALLEIGAGTGYFMKLVTKRRSGQIPIRLVMSDISGAMLRIAKEAFRVPSAEYLQIDVRRAFPLGSNEFDIVLATMVLNELAPKDIGNALREVSRVLVRGGRLIATVMHPDFVSSLQEKGKLSQLGPHFFTMPGKGSMRVPVVPHKSGIYEKAFIRSGFEFESNPVYPTEKVLRERAGLRHSKGLPLALVYEAVKSERES
jgi:ubiquinone/menaquinone biosynthesis C-methylase UbiE